MSDKGIIQQMMDSEPHDGSIDPMFQDLMNAIFDTSTPPPNPRYLWYAPIGHIRIENGSIQVLRDTDTGDYSPATEEERDTWNDLCQKLNQ